MYKQEALVLAAIAVCSSGLTCCLDPQECDEITGNGGSSNGIDGGGACDGPIGGFVGALTVESSVTFDVPVAIASFTAGAIFATGENVVVVNEDIVTFGDCIVTTIAIGGSEPDGTPPATPLDAGFEGTISNSTATATLAKLNEGTYGHAELAGGDLVSGASYRFQFEGGTDILGFETSIKLPESFLSTTPDLGDDSLVIDKSAALDVSWAPSGSAESAIIQVSTTDASMFVSIVCTVNDSGSTTVPQVAMERLADMPISTKISIARSNSDEFEVNLAGNKTGCVTVFARSVNSRTILAGLDTGGSDPCDLIQQFVCQEGETCNPLTLQCE